MNKRLVACLLACMLPVTAYAAPKMTPIPPPSVSNKAPTKTPPPAKVFVPVPVPEPTAGPRPTTPPNPVVQSQVQRQRATLPPPPSVSNAAPDAVATNPPRPLLASGPTAAPTPAPTMPPPPEIGTPSPEALAMPTRTPKGWIQAGQAGFDITKLSIDERTYLINQLQIANMRDAVRDTPVVQGTKTSREKPCYIGQRAQFKQKLQNRDNIVTDCTLSIAIMDMVRGDVGAQLVKDMNYLNEPAPAGKEYMVITLEFGVASDDQTSKFTFSMYEFQPISTKGRAYPYAFITDDQSVLDLYSGGMGTLRVTCLVDKGVDMLLLYRDTVWFSAKTLDP